MLKHALDIMFPGIKNKFTPDSKKGEKYFMFNHCFMSGNIFCIIIISHSEMPQ